MLLTRFSSLYPTPASAKGSSAANTPFTPFPFPKGPGILLGRSECISGPIASKLSSQSSIQQGSLVHPLSKPPRPPSSRSYLAWVRGRKQPFLQLRLGFWTVSPETWTESKPHIYLTLAPSIDPAVVPWRPRKFLHNAQISHFQAI